MAGQQGHYPYGESWYTVNTTTKWQFTSYERDSESLNDYAIFRYHVNRLGRFSSPDPLAGSMGNPQSLNRYAYVLGDPVNLIDPLGLDCWPVYNPLVGLTIRCEVTAPMPTGGGETQFGPRSLGAAGIHPPLLDGSEAGGGGGGGGGGGVGGGEGGFTLGVRAPNQTFSQCMQQHASDYSVAGLTDLVVDANGKVSGNFAVSAVAGNSITSTYYGIFGTTKQSAFNGLTTAAGSTPNIVAGGMGSVLTYGRRTADITALNIAGKGGLPQALSSSSAGIKGILGKVGKVTGGLFKLAADVGFTLAEAVGCSIPQ